MHENIKCETQITLFIYSWEQRKLGGILNNIPVNICLSPNEIGKYEVIQQGDVPIIGYTNEKPFIQYEDIVLFGDHTLSLYKPFSPFLVATDGVKAFSSNGLNGIFLYYLLMKNLPKNEGYKRYSTILKDKDIFLTYNKEEQAKISNIHYELDQSITLHQREQPRKEEIKYGKT